MKPLNKKPEELCGEALTQVRGGMGQNHSCELSDINATGMGAVADGNICIGAAAIGSKAHSKPADGEGDFAVGLGSSALGE